MTPTQAEFEYTAKNYWTPERLKKLVNDKKYFIAPNNAAFLLRVLGILNSDASISPNNTHKFIQINHMLSLMEPHIAELKTRHKLLNILDAGCGKSYLTFLLAWYFNRHSDDKKGDIYGVDNNKKLIQDCASKANLLGFEDSLHFASHSLLGLDWNAVTQPFITADSSQNGTRPHVVVALHACDTATDMALAFGLKNKSDFIAVAPCCQAELARKWKEHADKSHALSPVFHAPQLRREIAAQFTDTLRVCLMRANGYEVTCTEFVDSTHTPKNRLITCVRRGNYNTAAQKEYDELKAYLGGHSIMLENLILEDNPHGVS